MRVLKATKEDLPSLQDLMLKYGKMTADESLFNHRDIALQARADSGALVGFIWVGLMAKNTVGYIDKFIVDPEYKGQKVGFMLMKQVALELKKRGVRNVFGLIRQDEFHEASAMNALRGAMGAHNHSYTFVETDVNHSLAELKSAGVL